MNLNYLADPILYQMFKITLSIFKYNENIDDPAIIIFVNKLENRTTFKIKAGYYLQFLTPETMNILGRTKNKITKDKNGENVPHLETAELVLVHRFENI